MTDPIQLDENGRVILDQQAFIAALAAEHQHILFGDMNHSDLSIARLMASPEMADALGGAGITQLHTESFTTNQSISDPANADLQGFVTRLRAGDAEAQETLQAYADLHAYCWNEATSTAADATALAAEKMLNLAENGIAIHHSDSQEEMRAIFAELGFSTEERQLYWAMLVAKNTDNPELVYELRGTCSGLDADDISPELRAQADAFLDALQLMEDFPALQAEIEEARASLDMGTLDVLMPRLMESMTTLQAALPFLERYSTYGSALLMVRDYQNEAIAGRIAESCAEQQCVTTFGNGHMDGEMDLDEYLPNAVTIAVGASLEEAVEALRDDVDPSDYVFAADEGAYYHTPIVLEQYQGRQ